MSTTSPVRPSTWRATSAGSSPAPPSTSTAATPRPGLDPGRRRPVADVVKYGIALGSANAKFFGDITLEAERLGYESVWLPEHLMFTTRMSRSPHPGRDASAGPADHADLRRLHVPGVPRGSDRADPPRHPRLQHRPAAPVRHARVRCRRSTSSPAAGSSSASARAGSRRSGSRPSSTSPSRGRRVDECIEVCRRLWTEDEVTHHGEFFSFEGAVFVPKPVQQPGPPILVGGESGAALRRAARLGDGWIGMSHDFESGAASDRRGSGSCSTPRAATPRRSSSASVDPSRRSTTRGAGPTSA